LLKVMPVWSACKSLNNVSLFRWQALRHTMSKGRYRTPKKSDLVMIVKKKVRPIYIGLTRNQKILAVI